MTKRYELTDEQYEQVKELLPGKVGDPGRSGKDNRQFLNGVLWVLRSGAHWHDLPERYGKWKTAHKRFSRWAHKGVDSTLVKAHQQAAAGKRGLVTRLWGDPVGD